MSTKAPKTIDGFYEWICRAVPDGTPVRFQVNLYHHKEKGRLYSTTKFEVDLNDYGSNRPTAIRDLLCKSFHTLDEAGLWVTRQAIPLLKGARLEVPSPRQKRLASKPPGPLRLEHKPEPSPLIP